jgi:glycosyltransferase involved in cell wall biosynthesis
MRYRLAILNSHPIQYFAPLYRMLATHSQVDLMVYYCSQQGLKPYVDPGFGTALKWDIPLLDGYRYKFLPNWSWKQEVGGFWSLINPAIIGELRRGNYDAIIIYGYVYFTYWLAFLGAWLTGTPILMRGEANLLNYRPGWKRAIKRLGLTALFHGCASCLPIGRANADYYLHYGVPESKLFLAPYSVDNEFFMTAAQGFAAESKCLKARLGIDEGLPAILYASKMTPRKRAMDLLQAFHRLVQEGVQAQLLFVGDGEEHRRLEMYAEQHQLSNVRFLGFRNQSEMPQFYAIADIFVLPSAVEPWGLVINEAMCAGVPIVATDQVAAATDLIEHERNGYVYPVGNIGMLTQYLHKLLANPIQRVTMGRYSLEIISHWSYKECIDGILNALAFIHQRS